MRHTPFRPSRFAAALLVAGALAACSDAPTGAAPASEEATLAEQVAALGFRADMIEDHGDFVLVEGDIHLSKAQLRAVPVASGDPMSPKFQYRTTNLVTSANVRDIVVDVSGLASQPGWQTAAREALTHWSGTGSNVQMVEGSPADITVATTCTSYNVAAYASFPAGGNAGPTVYVNTCFGYSTSHAQKVHNMVHEFGHTIGFRHSNYAQRGETAGVEGAVHISGTPTSGNATGSVMNGGTALNSWAGFAASDLTAVRAIYPLAAPAITGVVNSGGYPLITWNAAPGALSYTIKLITYNTLNGQYQSRYFSFLANTTGTSYLDTDHPWTGEATCSSGYYDDLYGGETGHWYEYSVQANYSNGSSPADNARHYAYIADPYNCG
ncbi:MAG TPA: M57 family metalloprotease [Longimicrobium sp.]|nr:M57 family metalloprotease [Longimicrobium sp.]